MQELAAVGAEAGLGPVSTQVIEGDPRRALVAKVNKEEPHFPLLSGNIIFFRG
jgi:hypothetical protein